MSHLGNILSNHHCSIKTLWFFFLQKINDNSSFSTQNVILVHNYERFFFFKTKAKLFSVCTCCGVGGCNLRLNLSFQG